MSRALLKMKQIAPAHFGTEDGFTYSVLGLSENGQVYRYDPQCEGWIPWPMKMLAADCRHKHKARR